VRYQIGESVHILVEGLKSIGEVVAIYSNGNDYKYDVSYIGSTLRGGGRVLQEIYVIEVFDELQLYKKVES
jgi:hypothetical protein